MRLENSNNFIGKKFNRLKILSDKGRCKKFRMVEAVCECGIIGIYALARLRNGNTKSCGCMCDMKAAIAAITIHGMTHTKLFKIWCGIKSRCSTNTQRYGARGIAVCKEWSENFMCFYDWAQLHGWNESLEIDRIDFNGNYEPANCRFVTSKENSRNRSTNSLITYNDQTKCLAEWSEIFNLSGPMISYRIKKLGWSIEKALTTPPTKKYAPRIKKSC